MGARVNLAGTLEYFKCGFSRHALSHLTWEEKSLLVGRESVILLFLARSVKRGGGHKEATRSSGGNGVRKAGDFLFFLLLWIKKRNKQKLEAWMERLTD